MLNGQDLIDPTRKFNREALAAVKEFRASKPWRGTVEERRAKFEKLNAGLATAYGVPTPILKYVDDGVNLDPLVAFVGLEFGRFDPTTNTIYMTGKLSVVTYLHFFRGICGHPVEERFAWSINLFARMFPLSFSRCWFEGLILRNDHVRAEAQAA